MSRVRIVVAEMKTMHWPRLQTAECLTHQPQRPRVRSWYGTISSSSPWFTQYITALMGHSLWPTPIPSQCTLPFSQTELLSVLPLRPVLLRCGKPFLAFHWQRVGSLHSRRSSVCLYRQIYIFQIWVCFFSPQGLKKNDYLGTT